MIIHIVGTRPQFIKLAGVLGKGELIVHSGQHYDPQMDRVFFEELGLPKPHYMLGVGSGSHAEQTAKILVGFERVCIEKKPSLIVVYGDCNTTLAGALVAAKLGIRLAHVEAGVRSFDWGMPEEVNRVLTDRCASLLFAPTKTAVDNLKREGITKGVHLVGDIMYDMFLRYKGRSDIVKRLKLSEYILVTLHRVYNTDGRERLQGIFRGLSRLPLPVVMPLHPRTAARIKEFGISPAAIRILEPQGYLEMLGLEQGARLIITDSGGVQKEAYYAKKPCIVLRGSTEWPELVGKGTVLLEDYTRLPDEARRLLGQELGFVEGLLGDGRASERIRDVLKGFLEGG